MKVVRKKRVTQEAWMFHVMVFVSLMTLGMSRAAAQSGPAAPDDRPGGEAERTEEITVDEEITVVGQRSLRLLRLEVQIARERVYGLFNSLNSNDEFDVHCSNAPRTGTRIPQRVCRPQYADNGTSDAGQDFALALLFCGDTRAPAVPRGRHCGSLRRSSTAPVRRFRRVSQHGGTRPLLRKPSGS